jgi:hypothetical protein
MLMISSECQAFSTHGACNACSQCTAEGAPLTGPDLDEHSNTARMHPRTVRQGFVQ